LPPVANVEGNVIPFFTDGFSQKRFEGGSIGILQVVFGHEKQTSEIVAAQAFQKMPRLVYVMLGINTRSDEINLKAVCHRLIVDTLYLGWGRYMLTLARKIYGFVNIKDDC